MVDRRVVPIALTLKRADSPQTLREALREHQSNIPDFVEVDMTSASEIDRLFAGHDVIHCLFGLGSSVGEEIRVDAYTLCATTMTLRRYWAYMTHPVVTKVLRETTTLASAPSILWSFCLVPWIWFRSLRIVKWNFDGWEEYLDTPLTTLRAQLRIQL